MLFFSSKLHFHFLIKAKTVSHKQKKLLLSPFMEKYCDDGMVKLNVVFIIDKRFVPRLQYFINQEVLNLDDEFCLINYIHINLACNFAANLKLNGWPSQQSSVYIKQQSKISKLCLKGAASTLNSPHKRMSQLMAEGIQPDIQQ